MIQAEKMQKMEQLSPMDIKLKKINDLDSEKRMEAMPQFGVPSFMKIILKSEDFQSLLQKIIGCNVREHDLKKQPGGGMRRGFRSRAAQNADMFMDRNQLILLELGESINETIEGTEKTFNEKDILEIVKCIHLLEKMGETITDTERRIGNGAVHQNVGMAEDTKYQIDKMEKLKNLHKEILEVMKIMDPEKKELSFDKEKYSDTLEKMKNILGEKEAWLERSRLAREIMLKEADDQDIDAYEIAIAEADEQLKNKE